MPFFDHITVLQMLRESLETMFILAALVIKCYGSLAP